MTVDTIVSHSLQFFPSLHDTIALRGHTTIVPNQVGLIHHRSYNSFGEHETVRHLILRRARGIRRMQRR